MIRAGLLATVLLAAACGMKPPPPADPWSAFTATDRSDLAALRAWAETRREGRLIDALLDSAGRPVAQDITADPSLLELLRQEANP